MEWIAFRAHIRHLPEEDVALIEKAFVMGEKAHRNQKRQSGEPYFTHPVSVARILLGMGADRPTVIAALLHDTVEDTPLTLREIEESFGTEVAHLIDGVTKLVERPLRNNPSLDDRIETLRKMFKLMQEDVRIMIIKLADRLHNMQTIGFRSPEKQKSVAQETLDVYVKIADRLCMRDLRDELERLCIEVLEPERFPELERLRGGDRAVFDGIAPLLREKVCGKLGTDDVCDIHFEPKSWDSIRKEHEQGASSVPGMVNAVIVCGSADDCYRMLGVLHQLWQRETLTFEDYINAPLINGYQALHTTVILENGLHVRCKIRTREMQAYDTMGVATYSFGGNNAGLPQHLAWTDRILPLSADTQDRSSNFWESLRSDILGESNLVHGEGSATQLLPKGATALDGIFYLQGERGLNVEKISVNGKNVPFHEELAYGDSVRASFASTPQVQLKWLQYIRTGIGGAFIRRGLARQDKAVKRRLGQQLLQDAFDAKRRGFISEFRQEHLEELLQIHGFPQLESLYEQIAEGKIPPDEVERILFPAFSDTAQQAKGERYVLTCVIPNMSRGALLDTLRYYSVTNLRLLRSSDNKSAYRVSLILTPREIEMLRLTLDHLGSDSTYAIRKKNPLFKSSVASLVLVALWGLDPTLGHLLMQNPLITTVDMTVIRFLTLSVLSGGLFLWTNRQQPLRLTRLSWKNTSLWLSAVFLFLVSLATYASLADTTPLQYTIPMTCAGLFLTSIVNRRHTFLLATMWTVVAAGLCWLVLFADAWDAKAILYTFLAVLFFTAFTFVSERYKRDVQVSQRWAEYFFALSTICTLLCIAILPFASLSDLTPGALLSIVVFSVICTGIPYYIYYYLLSHQEIDFVLRYSFLIIPATLATQMLFVGAPLWNSYVSGLLVIAGAVLPLFDRSVLRQSLRMLGKTS